MVTESLVKARRTFFIDSENNINTCLQGIESLSEDDLVLVFHRESNLSQKQKSSIANSKARVEWILCQDSGVKNSLDVQLIAELSRRIACGEIENGYIISQDQGYNPAIHYLLNRYSEDFRFLGLKRSIDEFLLSDALVSSDTRNDIHEALVRYAGRVVGSAMYRTIRAVFDRTSGSDETTLPFGGKLDEQPLVPSYEIQDAQNESGEEGAERTSEEEQASQPAAKRTRRGGARRNRRKKAEAAREAEELAANENPPSVPAEAESDVQPAAAPEPEPATAQVEEEPERAEQAADAPAKPAVKRTRRSKKTAAAAAEDAAPEATPAEKAQAERPAKPKRGAAKKRAEKPASTEENAKAEAKPEAEAAPADAPAPAAPASRSRSAAAQAKLTSLPNIGLALAKRLEAVGVTTPQALKDTGSRAAWVLLKEQYRSAPLNWIYALEGAVREVQAKELDEALRDELREYARTTMIAAKDRAE